MSSLVVVVFDDELRAEEVRLDLLKLQSEHLVDLEDAVVLLRNAEGKVKLRHDSHLTVTGALTGGMVGALFGVILLNPVFAVLGLATGTALGAVSGSLTHLGIDEEFMKALAEHLRPNSSALCILVRGALEKVIDELNKFEGKVIQASLEEGYEKRIQELLDSLNASRSM